MGALTPREGGRGVCDAERGLYKGFCVEAVGWAGRWCNDLGDRQWELAWVSQHVGGQHLLHIRFKWRMRVKMFLYHPKRHRFDVKNIKTTSFDIVNFKNNNNNNWTIRFAGQTVGSIDLILVQTVFGPIDRIGLEPWLANSRTGQSDLVFKTMGFTHLTGGTYIKNVTCWRILKGYKI